MFPDWGRTIPTPALIYFLDGFRRAIGQFTGLCDARGIGCCYAVKANRHPKLLTVAAEMGLGFDIASVTEFDAVSRLGAARIFATGPGLDGPLMSDVDAASGTIFFDNHAQIGLAHEVGLDLGRHGIRLAMPGDYAAFGFAADEIADLRSRGFAPKKLHAHAGEYLDLADVETRLGHIRPVVDALGPDVIDLGGGFGVLSNRPEQLEAVLSAMDRFSEETGATILIEPGKALVARCGYLVATVLASKRRGEGQVAIINASSFNLGDMETRRLATASAGDKGCVPTTVIGPTCFEGDIWGQFELPMLVPDDRLIFANMGAYTKSIAATLHGLPAPEEHLID